MKRFVMAMLAVVLSWLGLAVAPAGAQNIYPYQAPRYGPGWQTPLSPYLNLLIPGNTAVNYYALVEPQFQRRQYRNVMSQTIQGLLTQYPEPPGIMPEQDLDSPMPATGHPTAFNYTGTYFNTLTGQSVPSEGGFAGRRMGAGTSTMGAGRGTGVGATRGMGGVMGMGSGAGVFPNMRSMMMPGGR